MIPGLQYPADLDPNSPIGAAIRMVVDNLIYLKNQTTSNSQLISNTIRNVTQNVTLTPGSGGTTPSSDTVMVGTHNIRLITTAVADMFFFETDRSSLYVGNASSGTAVWTYVSGLMYSTFATRPVDLGANDTNFLYMPSEHLHWCKWGGAAWVILDDDGGTFKESAKALGAGYQLCDGTATNYLAIAGADLTETIFITSDENSGAAGVYHTSIAFYTGVINAATAPTITGSTAAAPTGISTQNESAHTHAVTSPTGAPSATTTVDNTLAGSTVAVGSSTHTHTVTSPTGVGSNHAHGITDPTHLHGVGTLVVSATTQPRNMGVLRYFRR